jgi:uncharacterized membrane protein YhaH (DUF805 family)
MLGFLFGLNARLGRLQFFLASIALAIVMTVICFGIALVAIEHTSPSMLRPEDLLASWPTIAAIVVFGLATFTLQSMRIRDIGWDPVCVVPAWIALMIIDRLVATRFPAWVDRAGASGHGRRRPRQSRANACASVLAKRRGWRRAQHAG